MQGSPFPAPSPSMGTPVLTNATGASSPSVLANGTGVGRNTTDSGSNAPAGSTAASNGSNATAGGSNAPPSGSPSGFVGYPQSGGLLHPDLANLLLAIQEAHLYKDSKTAV